MLAWADYRGPALPAHNPECRDTQLPASRIQIEQEEDTARYGPLFAGILQILHRFQLLDEIVFLLAWKAQRSHHRQIPALQAYPDSEGVLLPSQIPHPEIESNLLPAEWHSLLPEASPASIDPVENPDPLDQAQKWTHYFYQNFHFKIRFKFVMILQES